jgi:flagellar biosynthetic protein FliR
MEFLCYSLLVGIRLTALVWSAPLLGHHSVPTWVRLSLGVLLTIVASSAGVPELAPGSLSTGLLGKVLSETLIGLLLGMGISILLYAGELMGDVISQMAGVSQGETDELGDAASPATRLITLLTIVLFALARGPEYLVGGVLESLRTIPPGTPLAQQTALELVGELFRQSLSLAVRGVGPAVAALLAATAAVNLFQRVLPGMGLNPIMPSLGMFVFAVAMFLTISGGLWLVDGNWEQGWQMVRQTLEQSAALAEPSNATVNPSLP